VVTTANIEYYAKIISEKSILRELINAGTEIVSMAYEEGTTETTLDSAEKLIFDIAQKKTSSDLVPVKDLVVPSYEQIEYRYNHKNEMIGVPTGFYDLDNLTAGLQKSDLVILAARPSMGKTAFCLNMAQNIGIKKKIPVAIFSLEMSKEQLAQGCCVRRLNWTQTDSEQDICNQKTGQNSPLQWDSLLMHQFLSTTLPG
jgi:replicative DNA helicase